MFRYDSCPVKVTPRRAHRVHGTFFSLLLHLLLRTKNETWQHMWEMPCIGQGEAEKKQIRQMYSVHKPHTVQVLPHVYARTQRVRQNRERNLFRFGRSGKTNAAQLLPFGREVGTGPYLPLHRDSFLLLEAPVHLSRNSFFSRTLRDILVRCGVGGVYL